MSLHVLIEGKLCYADIMNRLRCNLINFAIRHSHVFQHNLRTIN